MTNERRDVSIVTLNGKTPQIHDSAFIAPGSRIIGDVTIGADASVWYNCVIRDIMSCCTDASCTIALLSGFRQP